MKQRSVARWVGLYALVFVGVVFTVFPILWMFTISIRPSNELYLTPFRYIPPTPTLENFTNVLTNQTTVPAHLEQGFLRTVIVATLTTVLAVIIAALAGYALARFRFRGREPYGVVMLTTQMMPAVLFLVPLLHKRRQRPGQIHQRVRHPRPADAGYPQAVPPTRGIEP